MAISPKRYERCIYIIANAFWLGWNMYIGQKHQAMIFASLFLATIITWVCRALKKNVAIVSDISSAEIKLPRKICVVANAYDRNKKNKSIVVKLYFPGITPKTLCSIDYENVDGDSTLSLSAFRADSTNQPSVKINYLHYNLWDYDEELPGVRFFLLPSEVWGYFQDNKESLTGKMDITADNDSDDSYDRISAHLGNDKGEPFIEISVAGTAVYREYLYEDIYERQILNIYKKYLI